MTFVEYDIKQWRTWFTTRKPLTPRRALAAKRWAARRFVRQIEGQPPYLPANRNHVFNVPSIRLFEDYDASRKKWRIYVDVDVILDVFDKEERAWLMNRAIPSHHRVSLPRIDTRLAL